MSSKRLCYDSKQTNKKTLFKADTHGNRAVGYKLILVTQMLVIGEISATA